jgi:manganese-dependent inorganic pyrophosphatase
MEKIAVFGHKCPDTDSVLSAIIFAELLNNLGYEATPYVQEKINNESRFILDKFKVEPPKFFVNNGESIALVDTTNPMQLPENIQNIKFVVDHHNLGGLVTDSPFEVWIRPYGSTATILYEMYKFYKVEMSEKIKSLILSAILADTLNFASKSTTPKDREYVDAIAKEVNIKIESYWDEMLTAKSDISEMSDDEILRGDMKEFNFGGKKFLVSVIEIKTFDAIQARIQNIKDKLKEMKTKENCFGVLLLIIAVPIQKTIFMEFTDDDEQIAKLFNLKFVDNQCFVEGVPNRKSYIVPVLSSLQ